MINDFNTWLTSVVRFMGISTKLESTIEKFKHENFKVDREDIFSNKRQVSPGDHINKLKTERGIR